MRTALGIFLVLGLAGGAAEAGTISGTVTAPLKTTEGIVVYIDRIEGQTFDPPPEPVRLDQRNKEFLPHVLSLLKGSAIAFHNSDAFLHNVHGYRGRRSVFNLAVPPSNGKPITKTLDEPGEVLLLCDVHPEMTAYILVTETPYAAVTGADGHYAISDVPPGTYTLKTWHEQLKPVVQTVMVGAAPLEVNLLLK